MGKFKQKAVKELPEISTASLPDIVFMLLFFFMVATVMRKHSVMVANELPMADQTEKLEKKDLVMDIYVGKPSSRYKNKGSEPVIQLNDKIATLEDVKPFILEQRASTREQLVPFLITSLKVDKTTNMGIVHDVKKELRDINALKINYTTRQGNVLNNNY